VNPPGKFIGFDNYIRAFKDPNLYNAFRNNIEFLVIIILINFWCPILLAILANEVRLGRTMIRTFYFIPALAPGVAMIVLWKYIWQPDYGFANYLFNLLGLKPQMWLNDPSMVKWCIQIPGLILVGGVGFIIYLAAIQDISVEQYEAALIEGSGFIKRIMYIVIPQITRVVGIMFVLTIIGVFNMVDVPLVMTGGGPMGKTETLYLYAFRVAYRDTEYSYSITLTMICFFVVFIITAIQMKMSKE
jgi:ABC-type sugar transport systems, permease components